MPFTRNEQVALLSVFFTRTSEEEYAQFTGKSLWNAFCAELPSMQGEALKTALAYTDYKHFLNTVLTPGIPGSFPPVESLYKDWGGKRAGLQHGQGYYLGESALHARSVYAALGIEIPHEFQAMPDHLVLLLELNEYLREHASAQDAFEFAQHHFDWLGDYCVLIEERFVNAEDASLARAAKFYSALLAYLETFVHENTLLQNAQEFLKDIPGELSRNTEEVILQ